MPKFGFRNPNRVEYKPINLDAIQELAEKFKAKAIDVDFLREHGMAGKKDLIKILNRGELKTKVDITAHAFSASAIAAIEKAGGKATTL